MIINKYPNTIQAEWVRNKIDKLGRKRSIKEKIWITFTLIYFLYLGIPGTFGIIPNILIGLALFLIIKKSFCHYTNMAIFRNLQKIK